MNPNEQNSPLFLVGARIVFTLLLLSAAGPPARADYRSTVMSQNPVGYWPLDETLQPPPQPVFATNLGSFGPAIDGGILNGVIRGEPGVLAGTSDTSERFTNPTWSIFTVGSYVSAPYTPALNPNGPFTVEFWAKPTSRPNDVFAIVCSLDTGVLNSPKRDGYVFYVDGPGLGWQFRLGNDTGYPAVASGGSFTPNTWSHVVGSFTGSSLVLYVDGAQVAVTNFNAADFLPNTNAHFNIGMTTFPNRTFDGWIEEVAFYTNVLDAATVKAHFDAATTNGPGYAAQILADNPLGYWRLGEPGDPPAANLGSLGAAANGSYIAPSHPGAAGPQSPSFSGLGETNNALGLDVFGGYATVPALNLNTNTVTITGWVRADGPQAPLAAVLFDRWVGTAAGITMDAGGGHGLGYTWNNDPQTYNWSSGLSLPDSDWAYVALVVQPSQAALFVAADTNYSTFSGATNVLSHPAQAFDGLTYLGGDLGASDRFFVGALDEIAIFNRALSVGDVFNQYAAAVGNVPPQTFGGPQAPTNQLYAGNSLNLEVDAGGSAPLTYQWRKDGADIADATSSRYLIPSLDATNSGVYELAVSNAFGFAVSPAAVIQISSETPPEISGQPAGRTLYTGGTLSLGVVASGGTLEYQWEKDGNPIPGATNATYVVPGVSADDAGVYVVTAQNSRGSATSEPATVVVISPASGTYAAAIVADQPEAWWRLDEPLDATELHDAMGRHDGVVDGVVTLGVPGAVPGDSDTAVSLDGTGFGRIPFSPEFNPSSFTLECWAKTRDLRDNLCPASSHYLARGFYFVSAAQGPGQWDAAFGSVGLDYYLPSTAPAATMKPDTWAYLVITFDPTNLFRFYINGQWDGAVYIDFDHNAAGPLLLGARGNSSSTPADLLWKGEIDEVAFYDRALPLSRVQAHYAAAVYGTNTTPVFKLQPKSQVAELGTSLQLDTRVEGALPLALQWFKDGAPIAGETNAALTLSNLSYSASGEYRLAATNAAGFTQSIPATVLAMPAPGFANLTNGLVLHLTFDNNLADSSGLMHDALSNGAPVFVPGLIGTGAVQVSTTVASSNYNYVSIPYSTDFALSSTDGFTLSFWVNYTGTPDDLPMVGDAVGSTFQQGWVLADKSGKLTWTLVDTNGSSVLANPAGGPSLNDGKWHNVMLSFDGAVATADTYIDGAWVTSRAIALLDAFDTGQPICLGQDPTGTYAIDGVFQIDDLGMWRRPLSYYDAQAIFELGQKYGLSFDTYGPVILTQTPSQNGFQLIWQAGTLMEADAIDGPWTPVAGATAPIYSVTPGTGNKFYRVKL